MQDQRKAKFRRLSIWFSINLVIFLVCYLNYYLQQKHRYLYKILNVGLCLSRAAAMVINFNLLLVWLPMCKYTLTRLARSLSRIIECKKHKLKDMHAAMGKVELDISTKNQNWLAKLHKLGRKEIKRLNCLVLEVKIKSINSFLVAVDNCTSLHTICATTITLASVIHTVAHFINVVNFSKRFDPFLTNLNMAEYKGQNPFQLLVSVPGITGCFMIIILLLMSLSSIYFIRNTSFDLFQIFHRLSIIFVILLILHPSSHVLKEQSNVDRHNPDYCYKIMTTLEDDHNDQIVNNEDYQLMKRRANLSDASSALNSYADSAQPSPLTKQQQQQHVHVNFRNDESPAKLTEQNSSPSNVYSHERSTTSKSNISHDYLQTSPTEVHRSKSQDSDKLISKQCLDKQPKFVTQSSICWYVLSVGLTCYLLDLILRRLRRCRSTIELLEAKTNSENNLIELVLDSNHKRFNNWLPGQFVYLNCPQISSYEWHPFTISSMDDERKQFTLHIKTNGDWTKRLKSELEIRRLVNCAHNQGKCTSQHNGLTLNSMFPSLKQLQNNPLKLDKIGREQLDFSQHVDTCSHPLYYCISLPRSKIDYNLVVNSSSNNNSNHFTTTGGSGGSSKSSQLSSKSQVANFQCFEQHQTGNFKVDCKRLEPIEYNIDIQKQQFNLSNKCEITLSEIRHHDEYNGNFSHKIIIEPSTQFKLFVDGPFHSPFERLLEQQVSVCISNGVGWTAFSSVFQRISKNQNAEQELNWWSKWNKFTVFANRRRQQICPTHNNNNSSQCWQSTSSSSSSSSSSSMSSSSSTEFVEDSVSTASASTKTLEQQQQQPRFPLPAAAAAKATSTSVMSRGKKFDTKLHLIVIVTTIEQLKPFYKIALRYFRDLQNSRGEASSDTRICIEHDCELFNVVREVTVFLTRSKKDDENVKLFCQEEKLSLQSENTTAKSIYWDTIKINEIFSIHFGKPNLDDYLRKFSQIYADKRKISVYCCGSYQVKRIVAGLCRDLNCRHSQVANVESMHTSKSVKKPTKPIYCYHEENF